MESLLPAAHRIGALLKASGAKVAVAESSAGGLISVYTRLSRNLLLDLSDDALRSVAPNSEAMAALLADAVRARFESTWSLAETGAAGPGGNRYGHPSGRGCFAVAGPLSARIQVDTGIDDRAENMRLFAAAALDLFERVLQA